MTTLFYFLDLLFFVLLALSVGYLFVFALASKFGHPHRYPQTAMLHTFGIIFPAYKEDSVILSAVRSFLEQDYPADRYYIVVVSDQMQKSTNEALRTLPIRLLIANYPNSSKAKALAFAARTDEIRSS
ncbi:MAG: glycosyltransferase family 2 protein, partial [Bacteroides sp.]